ncbi:MAG: PIN domain-containing protein, partial [Candidatus Bipolaricaulota bacterium]|nr:PIN domain-containing protein [Candidatus Bipolaricaulota bacterium]
IRREVFALSLPVLTESWLLVEARLGRFFADKIWEAATNGVFAVLEVGREDLQIALAIEQQYHDVGFGFVDATCLALCEKHKIVKVFTYDRRHFALYKPSFAYHLELLP